VLEVLAGEGILFVRESAHELQLDFRLSGQFFELRIVKKEFRPSDVDFVQFDPNVPSVFVQFRRAGETHEHGFEIRHAFALEGQIYRALPDDEIYLTKLSNIEHKLIRSANPSFYPLQVKWQTVFHADIVRSKADHDAVVR